MTFGRGQGTGCRRSPWRSRAPGKGQHPREISFMTTAPAPSAGREKTLVVVTDGWGPSFGGINAFNLDFCLALGRLLRGRARVVCLAPPVQEAVRAAVAG